MDEILLIVFNVITRVAMLLLFIRFMMQFAGLERRDPIAMPAYKATQVVDVFSRIFPTVGNGRINLAAIVLMFLVRLIFLSGNAAIQGTGYSPVALLGVGCFSLVLDFLKMCFYLIVGSIIVSWIVVFTNSMHPLLGLIMQLAEPILAPFRRLSPDLGMIDISPIFAFLTIIILEKITEYALIQFVSMV